MQLADDMNRWTWYNREQEFNMNCAAVNITLPTPPSTSSIDPTGYQQPATATTGPEGGASPSPTKPANLYKTANGLLCTCTDPTNISTCDCACPGALAVNDKRENLGERPVLSLSLPFYARPTMLVADDGNGCLTPRTDAELKYPEPGPEVVTSDGEYPLRLPEGHCMGLVQGR
jgi:hypothetical protein